MNVLNKLCTTHSPCALVAHSKAFCPTAFGSLGPPGDTYVLTFSRLPTWASQHSQAVRKRNRQKKPIETIQVKDFERLETVLKKSAEK